MPVSLTVYDGADTVGGNKILLEDGGTAVFLDFGTSFAARARYYDQFLAPRSRAGLLDLIHMGLLPPLRGIYRGDLEGAGDAWERARRYPHYRDCRVDAVLLSHAHMDHCGYISFLDAGIPVVSTCMTAYLAKAIQDCGAHQFEGEICYTVPKVASDEGVIGAGSHRDLPFGRRPYLAADGICADPGDFWNLSPSPPRGRNFPRQRLGTTDRVGALRVRFLPVDHSIYGAAAIAVETSAGWVVYTGDLRRHGTRRAMTEAFVREAAALRPVALVCEGTNVGKAPGATEEGSTRRAMPRSEPSRGRSSWPISAPPRRAPADFPGDRPQHWPPPRPHRQGGLPAGGDACGGPVGPHARDGPAPGRLPPGPAQAGAVGEARAAMVPRPSGRRRDPRRSRRVHLLLLVGRRGGTGRHRPL